MTELSHVVGPNHADLESSSQNGPNRAQDPSPAFLIEPVRQPRGAQNPRHGSQKPTAKNKKPTANRRGLVHGSVTNEQLGTR